MSPRGDGGRSIQGISRLRPRGGRGEAYDADRRILDLGPRNSRFDGLARLLVLSPSLCSLYRVLAVLAWDTQESAVRLAELWDVQTADSMTA